MNIEYANSIPLRVILSKIGYEPKYALGNDLTYLSPLCQDEQSVLVVDTRTNTWSDDTLQLGGDVISFVCAYLKSQNENYTVVDALRWLRNMVGYAVLLPPVDAIDFTKTDELLEIKAVEYLSSFALIQYLEEERNIPFDYARFLLKEIKLFNAASQKHFKALGLQNEEKGFAIRNPHVKAHVRPPAVTFIRGQVVKPSGIHVFKDVFDYLSLIAYRKGSLLPNDAIILNSYQCMSESAAYIRHYGYKNAFTWLDNTSLGNDATKLYAQFFKTEPNLRHISMNRVFHGFKDVNDWWANQKTT